VSSNRSIDQSDWLAGGRLAGLDRSIHRSVDRSTTTAPPASHQRTQPKDLLTHFIPHTQSITNRRRLGRHPSQGQCSIVVNVSGLMVVGSALRLRRRSILFVCVVDDAAEEAEEGPAGWWWAVQV
jgi:hypothetical protein